MFYCLNLIFTFVSTDYIFLDNLFTFVLLCCGLIYTCIFVYVCILTLHFGSRDDTDWDPFRIGVVCVKPYFSHHSIFYQLLECLWQLTHWLTWLTFRTLHLRFESRLLSGRKSCVIMSDSKKKFFHRWWSCVIISIIIIVNGRSCFQRSRQVLKRNKSWRQTFLIDWLIIVTKLYYCTQFF